MEKKLHSIQLLEEVQEFIPVMTSLELGLITNGLLELTPNSLAHWQKLLNSWVRRREDMMNRIQKAYAKQR